MTTQYYYGTDGGDVQGPLALDQISAAVAAGRLPGAVVVSESPSGPWEPFTALKKPESGARITPAPDKSGVVEWVTVIARFHLVVAAVGLLAAALMLMEKNPATLTVAIAAASNVLAGVLFFAIADALTSLREIRDALRK